VFLSTNNGTSWTAVNTGLTYPLVNALAVSGTNLFAGTGRDGVFLSTNNGTSWIAVNTGLTNLYVYAFAVSGTNLFAGTFGGVFLSTNNGTSWTDVNAGLPQSTKVYAFAVSGTNLFAGTDGGVFLSANNGTSWTAVNAGLTYPYVYSVAVSGTNLFAGTGGRSVWRRPLSEMTAVESLPNEMPGEFVLEQNYPNPFNPATTIEYGLPSASRVELRLYDILGREVATLVNEVQTAGYHSVRFDASGLASGVYFYRLRAGEFTQTKRMLLLR